MNNEIIKKVNEGIMDTKIDLTYKEFESIVRELQDKDKEIRELKKLKEELEKVKSENRSLKFKNIGEKISGKVDSEFLKTGSKCCSRALKFEKTIDKITLKDLESKKVEDLTLNDCIEECLIRLKLGQDKHKGKLFEIDLIRYFHLLYNHEEDQDYLINAIMDEGYDEVCLDIKPVEVDYRYAARYEITLKVRIPE